MNTRIQRAILTATILTFAAAPLLFAGELPYSWYVNANGEASASATFGVNASDRWCEGTTVTGPVMIATDVEEAGR